MYKSSFKIFGRTGLTVLLLTFAITMTLWTTIGYEYLPREDQLFMRLGWPSLGVLVVFLGHKVSFRMNQISIDEKTIRISNLVTRRTKEIDKHNLKGYKDRLFDGYWLLLVDQSDKVVARINDSYYSDFNTLRDNLGLEYLGRVPTFWDKFIKIEVVEGEK